MVGLAVGTKSSLYEEATPFDWSSYNNTFQVRTSCDCYPCFCVIGTHREQPTFAISPSPFDAFQSSTSFIKALEMLQLKRRRKVLRKTMQLVVYSTSLCFHACISGGVCSLCFEFVSPSVFGDLSHATTVGESPTTMILIRTYIQSTQQALRGTSHALNFSIYLW